MGALIFGREIFPLGRAPPPPLGRLIPPPPPPPRKPPPPPPPRPPKPAREISAEISEQEINTAQDFMNELSFIIPDLLQQPWLWLRELGEQLQARVKVEVLHQSRNSSR
ncbi:MAG TPA: hypothetical protein DIW81_18095 [Planctomycetaceae bacterium]|nr:hypothetical protein [Planctomycetaceae bacterium]